MKYKVEDDIKAIVAPSEYTVTFKNSIIVVEILSRSEDCEDTKKNLWRGHIAEMATQNIMKFRIDGWDWRIATEEGKRLVYCENNDNDKSIQVLHPATFHKLKQEGHSGTSSCRTKSEEEAKEGTR